MVARFLIAFLLLQAAIFAWLAAAIFHLPWSRWTALLASAAMGVLCVRAILVGVTFVVAWWGGRQGNQASLGLIPSIGLYLREAALQALLFSVLQIFPKWFQPSPLLLGVRQPKEPLVLVHGLWCNAGAWWRFAKRLEVAGFGAVHAVTLEPATADIEILADQLAVEVDALRAATGAPSITMVAHSMGGLIARAYLRKHGHAAVRQVITLGTPHHGTILARLSAGLAVRQMRPDHPWLKELNRGGPSAATVPFVSIYSLHDNLVSPQASAELPYARCIPVRGVGHVDLLFRQEVFELVLEALQFSANDSTVGVGRM